MKIAKKQFQQVKMFRAYLLQNQDCIFKSQDVLYLNTF
jgi:hypothetical protein